MTSSYFFHDFQSNENSLIEPEISPLPEPEISSLIESELSPFIEYSLQILCSDKIGQIYEINSLFKFFNQIEITNYLIENSSLVPILLDAYDQIQKVFTRNEKLSLKLCLDPDIPNWEKLLLSIHVGEDADVDEMYQLKDNLDDNWWIDVYSSVPNLDIHVSFDEF